MLVETAAPAVEDVLDMAELPGDLLPARRAVLAAEVPGTIESVTVDLGDAVRRGQTLVTIDTRALAQAVAEAESVFRQTTAQRERAENLFEKRSITKKDLLDAVTNQEVAESRLASARLELAKSRVSAPWAGRVTGKRVEVGDYATPGMPLIELVERPGARPVPRGGRPGDSEGAGFYFTLPEPGKRAQYVAALRQGR